MGQVILLLLALLLCACVQDHPPYCRSEAHQEWRGGPVEFSCRYPDHVEIWR